MANLTRAQAKTILYNLGWRVNTSARLTQAVKDFQAGWNLGPALSVDGSVGPKTSAALRLSESRRRAGRTTASANFSFKTVACRCGGKYGSCRRIFYKRKRLSGITRKGAWDIPLYQHVAALQGIGLSEVLQPLATQQDLPLTYRVVSQYRQSQPRSSPRTLAGVEMRTVIV
jgi:lysozyme family protein